MRRALQFFGCVAATTLAASLFAGQASAHVTVSPLGTVQAGGFAKLGINVPNERPDAGTVKVTVQMPKDQAIRFVSVQPKTGWEVATTTRQLDNPVSGEGDSTSEVVDTITWTATGDTQIAPGQFDQFWISAGPIPDVSMLSFPAIQTYSSGEEVAWIESMGANGQEPDHPAPTVSVVAANSDTAATGTSGSGDGNALAIIAIMIGALGLGTGAAGIRIARKTRQETPDDNSPSDSRTPVAVG